jgi:hypothetical protein
VLSNTRQNLPVVFIVANKSVILSRLINVVFSLREYKDVYQVGEKLSCDGSCIPLVILSDSLSPFSEGTLFLLLVVN